MVGNERRKLCRGAIAAALRGVLCGTGGCQVGGSRVAVRGSRAK